MKKLKNGSPLDLWNSGDLLDYLDGCIHDSQLVASELIYATDNTDNKVDNVFTTPEFDTGVKVLIKKHKTTDLKKLKEVIKQLLYEGAVATQCHNHELINKNGGNPHMLNELHVSGDVLLHYRYWGDNTLIISLGVKLPTENGASINIKRYDAIVLRKLYKRSHYGQRNTL